jgi:hypothetical protein
VPVHVLLARLPKPKNARKYCELNGAKKGAPNCCSKGDGRFDQPGDVATGRNKRRRSTWEQRATVEVKAIVGLESVVDGKEKTQVSGQRQAPCVNPALVLDPAG